MMRVGGTLRIMIWRPRAVLCSMSAIWCVDICHLAEDVSGMSNT
jgi:hypothetical protein